MSRIERLSCLLLLGLWPLYCLTASEAAEMVFHAQGELAGEVTASGVLLQTRLTALPGPALDEQGDLPGAAGVVSFEWSEHRDFREARRSEWRSTSAENDFIVREKIENLRPHTTYYYRLVYGPDRDRLRRGATRQFKTLPARDQDVPLSFCMGSCMNYAFFMHGKSNDNQQRASEEDRALGYPSFAAMLALEPDFFVGTGDIVYYDHPAKTAAQTLPELRKKWHEQFRFPRMVEFFARTPAYWSKDDHDFRFNDADLERDKMPLPATGIEIFREQMPIFPADDRVSPTYRTHRVHKHVQLWFTEGRDFRSPNNSPDGPGKSLWGAEQRAWLQSTLAASDATWKIIISPTPMVGPDNASKKDNHTNLNGFRHEAESFLQWLREREIGQVMTFCGDRHWQYHSLHPLGMEEFSVGALNDENAIAGLRPGQKNSTDPEGRIEQPFLYDKPSGGFLSVAVTYDDNGQPRLRIAFYNDEGQTLYSVTKQPRQD